MGYPRVQILIIDKDMNTVSLNIPTFMLSQLNVDQETVKKHNTKRELNAEISEFLKQFEK